MLVDYHIHLREDRTEPEGAFTEANLARYIDAAKKRNVTEIGISEHIYRFWQGLQICSDPFWKRWGRDDLSHYVEFLKNSPARVGIEVDYVPGREAVTEKLLLEHDFDYVIGSVHTINGLAIDSENDPVWKQMSVEEVWREYFKLLAEAVRSQLFDIFAHPDLVKILGHFPKGDLLEFYKPFLVAVSENDVVIEISTAGLRKPVAEIYPSQDLLSLLREAGARFTISSDAHKPSDVACDYPKALALLRDTGIRELVRFRDRTKEDFVITP